ncbi:MAG: hypothetical protein IKH18_11045 [Clostridia bacterium]|nr:hypothetical protein [Clostridia bacterium]
MYNFDFDYIKKGTPIVTLSSLGIAFNRASVEQLGSPEKVLVGYDASAHVIGVKPAAIEGKGSVYDFATRMKNDWVRIGCRDFVKKLAIDTEMGFDKKAIQFIATYDSDLQMLIIPIDEKHRKSQK